MRSNAMPAVATALAAIILIGLGRQWKMGWLAVLFAALATFLLAVWAFENARGQPRRV